jgi:Zn-dependent protease
MFSCFSVKSGQNGIGVTIFGFTRSDAVNVAVGVLGYYSLMVAAFYLLPLPPLVA